MRSPSFTAFVLASVLAARVGAVTLNQWTQMTRTTYDYVIIGAGNAGLVVANRLTEDPRVSVLVIEAGISDLGLVEAQAPFLGPTLSPGGKLDWNYTITPQVGMDGKSFPYPRGYALGGCTTINYCFHQYGSNADWTRFANVTQDPSWAWDNMKQYKTRHEDLVPPLDGHDTSNQVIASLHSTSGLTKISLPGYNQSIDPRVIALTTQSPEWPFNQDMSGGDRSLLGMGWLQSSAGGGIRSSSSTSYLNPVNTRPNLTVVINTTVLKLLQTGTSGGKPTFLGVQISSSPGTSNVPGGRIGTVTARKEVILSAGTVGTPQILQLSGIGDKNLLQPLGIPTIINNPNVGANLIDHTFLPNIFSVNGNDTLDNMLRSNVSVQNTINQFVQTKTGVFANNVVNNFGFSRIPANSSIYQTVADPASGPDSPHWEIIPSDYWFRPGGTRPATGSYVTFVSVLLTPTSRGTIKIKSKNPFDAPLIDPRYLTTAFDIFAMRETVKSIKRLVATPAWADYVTGPFGDSFVAAVDDASIDAYVRDVTTTIFHPVGTAAMAPASSNAGVVNPDLTLKGANGLRIVDASVFPYNPSAHTQGPLYLLAEKASDLIKAAN
ncbi:alcohol oxidase [Pholiota conissans]|uniref:pyranose dehydrogenase (acceptor) n=1 Tax=Pholiota conissans TaxID=109636 RepID=A0A9P6CY13_9AGAR|nr:alcohol oxidase [Pholiota conissans]